ncbi:hypothetical protein EDC04DRAFT_2902091 [Pisolithus marmoratus]|nr:hypothetical protein EDC04DRAFT_2902091 [Pisolithus marmoratus]
MPTLSLLDHALSSTSTAQLSQTLVRHSHLGYMHYGAAPGDGIGTIDGREPQRPVSSSSEDFYVSISELPSCPTIPAPAPQVPTSGLVGNLNGEQDSAQVALPLGFIAGESEGSLIIKVSHLVNQGRGYWGTQRAFDYVTNDDATLSSPYTRDLLQLIAIGQPPRYPQENENISTFDLDCGCAEPSMGPSIHGHTSGQVIYSAVPSPGLSSPPLPSVQEPSLADGLNSDYFPPPPEHIRTNMAPPAQLPSMQTITQTYPQAPIPYSSPVLSQFNSASDDYISFGPSSLMPNQIPSSQSPQERLGYLPVHPHDTIPTGLPGLHEFHAGSNADLYTTRTVNNSAAHIVGDQPSLTHSDHGAQPFGDHGTYIFDDHTAAMISGGVDDYGTSKCTEQVVGSRSQSSLPPNQLSLSPRGLHPHDRTDGRNLSGIIRHARRSATSQPRTSMRLPEARSIGDRDVYHACGWRDEKGKECGALIRFGDCPDHFAAVHDIKNIKWDAQLICRWCSPETQKEVIRKNLMRHVREAHLGCLRAKKVYGHELKPGASDKSVLPS